MRQNLHRLRTGFVLPMSLVVTFITMLFVGASATYCTTQFRTSQQYLSRTRCRLVAQSAIEMTKLTLMEKCGVGELSAINLGGLTVANIDGVLPSVLSETRKEEFLRKIPGAGAGMTVTVDIKPGTGSQAGIYYILATAEHKQAGRTTTVTLREGIKVPISSSNIFDYAYFANHDGHLTSQYMVINGDVRANRDFYITGAEINGYVYASNTVHLATEKNKWGWRDDKDPSIRAMDSYNSTYRKGSKKELNAYAKARPTNPLSSRGKQEWVGGFEAPDPVTTTTTATFGWGLWKKTYETTTTSVTPDLDSDKLTPSQVVPESKEDHIVNAQAIHDEDTQTWGWGRVKDQRGRQINRSPGYLKIPQIDWSDSGAYGLQYYKNRAASCSTVKGKTGGSLICSNCFVNAEGRVEQLSAKLALEWTNKTQSRSDEEIIRGGRDGSIDFDPEDVSGTEQQEGHIYRDELLERDSHSTLKYLPPNGVFVYDCLTADAFDRLVGSAETKAKNWKQLQGEYSAQMPDGSVGDLTFGYVGTIARTGDSAGNHANATLFIDGEMLDSKMRSVLGKSVDDIAVKFEGRQLQKQEATYGARKSGEQLIKESFVQLYEYRSSLSGLSSRDQRSWNEIPTTWKYQNGRYTTTPTWYSDSSAGRCFDGGDATFVSFVSTCSGSPYRISESSVIGSWSLRSGYYKSASKYLRLSLVKVVDGNSTTYEVRRAVVDSNRTGSGISTADVRTTYTYTGYYYSTNPLGYITIDDGMVDEPVIKYHSYEDLEGLTENSVEKVLATKFVTLYGYSAADRSPGSYWTKVGDRNAAINAGDYCNTKNTTFKNHAFKKSELNTAASSLVSGFNGVSAEDLTSLFADGEDDWTTCRSGTGWFRPSGTYSRVQYDYGYMAIDLVGTYSGNSVDYEFRFRLVDSAGKSQEESRTPETDVMEVFYIPVHAYTDSRTRPSGWTTVSDAKSGYKNSSSSLFNDSYVLKSEIASASEGFVGSFYGLSDTAIADYFTSRDGQNAGWAVPASSGSYWSSYGYYNSSIKGYMAVKIIRTKNTDWWGKVTYSYSLRFSDFVNPEDKDESQIRDPIGKGVVLPNYIPVYDHISEDDWRNLAYWQKTRWTAAAKGTWYRNVNTDRYFLPSDMKKVAAYWDGQYPGNGLGEAVPALFTSSSGEGYTDGWRSTSSDGYVSTTPVGYLEIGVEMKQTPMLTYRYLAAGTGDSDPGEITGMKDVSVPDYYKSEGHIGELIDHLKEIGRYDHYSSWTESGTTTTRELRRIFVKGGYKIDTTPRFYEGTGDEDLILTRGGQNNAVLSRLNAGSTTADLRPFREDMGYNCNRMTSENCSDADKGAVILIGTWDFPICIDGDVVFESDVVIRGFVSGRGTIYSGRNIHVIGDINYKDPPYWPDTGSEPETKGKDMLYLISRGSIVFGNYAKYGTTSMDSQWSGSDSLLSGNYINGKANTSDPRSRWGRNNQDYVPYVEMDYTQNDTKGWTKYKVVCKKGSNGKYMLDKAQVKYYESVVGDYVFISKNDSNNTAPNEDSAMTSYGSSCRFAQTWDCNLGGVSALRTRENFCRYLPYQSKFLDAYAKHSGWKSVDRVGTSAKTMTDLWDTYRSDIWNFYTTAQSDGYGGYSTGYSGGYGGTYSGSSQKPSMTEIQDINAVLYSSMGIFGIIGGKYAPVTINGAVICQDEALFPYTHYQARRWGWWSWRTSSSKTSDLAMTINWDIRLNNKSTESRFNQEGEDQITPPVTTDVDDSGSANAPRTLTWQEVPDSFNEEYHATP